MSTRKVAKKAVKTVDDGTFAGATDAELQLLIIDWVRYHGVTRLGLEHDDEIHRAGIRLLRSDIPLDAFSRNGLANDLEYLYFKTRVRTLARNIQNTLAETRYERERMKFLMSSDNISEPEARKRMTNGSEEAAEALRKRLEREETDRSEIADIMREKGVSEIEAIELLVVSKAEDRKRRKDKKTASPSEASAWRQDETGRSRVKYSAPLSRKPASIKK